MTTKIVWNDCDEYVFLEDAARSSDYNVDGDKLIGRTETHTAIEVFKVDIASVPTYEDDDELDFTGFYLVGGNAYLPVVA